MDDLAAANLTAGEARSQPVHPLLDSWPGTVILSCGADIRCTVSLCATTLTDMDLLFVPGPVVDAFRARASVEGRRQGQR